MKFRLSMSHEQLLVVTPDTGNYESNISYGAYNCAYKDPRKNQKGHRTVMLTIPSEGVK